MTPNERIKQALCDWNRLAPIEWRKTHGDILVAVLTAAEKVDFEKLGEAYDYFNDHPEKHPNVNGYFNVITDASRALTAASEKTLDLEPDVEVAYSQLLMEAWNTRRDNPTFDWFKTYADKIKGLLAQPKAEWINCADIEPPKDQTDILVRGLVEGKISKPAMVYFEPYENRGWLCSRTHKPIKYPLVYWMEIAPIPPKARAEGRE